MKKAIIFIVAILILLYLVFNSRLAQDSANQFVESNESHERKLIEDFLSQ